jgi:two-component system OmpR family response regulator
MQILIVEDDARLSSALAHILKENHYQVDTVSDGATGLEWAASGIYDVVILDVMLPKMNGFDVVAELRRKGDSTPVLLLTARDSISDKITGLDSGADDYMTKPFSPTELMAHLRMLTRRQGEVVFEKLDFADLSLNLDSLEVSCRDKTIHLSVKEFSIAKILMTNPTQIASKEMLIDKVWGMDSNAEDNNVEAYISFLRKKLKFLGSRVQIETIRKGWIPFGGYRDVGIQGHRRTTGIAGHAA